MNKQQHEVACNVINELLKGYRVRIKCVVLVCSSQEESNKLRLFSFYVHAMDR